MHVFTHVTALRTALAPLRSQGKRIALVPTMGNLHDGHIQLVRKARECADVVVSTIFVNPMQFGPSEDLDAYPRTLAQDIDKLTAVSCDMLLTPSVTEMYPQGHAHHTVVSVPGLANRHCGASRPGHFDGVATVVSKLFHIVEPHIAVFGLKDYQQFQVIRKMVADLCMPIQLVGVETQREPSGLALSSRNGYLTAPEKEQAVALITTLRDMAQGLQRGVAIAALEQEALQALTRAGFRPDYITVCHADTLEPATEQDTSLVILAAAWMGKTRLIDNLRMTR